MTETIRLVLADDHPLVRSGIRMMLSNEQDMVIVAEAATGSQVQRLCIEINPDVLLLDLNMPGPSAVETVAYLHAHCSQVKILVLTAYNDDAYVRGLVSVGVAGYVLKDEAMDAVVRAIRAVMCGDPWFSRSIMEKLVQNQVHTTGPDDNPALTDRERQLLDLMARGWDNIRIAAELCLAEQTVRNYVSRIYLALGLSTRGEAIIWARARGLGGTPSHSLSK